MLGSILSEEIQDQASKSESATLDPKTEEAQAAIQNGLTSISQQLERGFQAPRFSTELRAEVTKSITELLKLPEGSKVSIIPQYLGSSKDPAIVGTITIPGENGQERSITFGIDNAKSIYLGGESTGAFHAQNLSGGLYVKYDQAANLLPGIFKGFSASQGLQYPLEVQSKDGAQHVILGTMGLDLLKRRADGSFAPLTKADAEKLSVVKISEDGSIAVEKGTDKSKRLAVPGSSGCRISLATESLGVFDLFYDPDESSTGSQLIQIGKEIMDKLNKYSNNPPPNEGP